jgi:hypothetical protein
MKFEFLRYTLVGIVFTFSNMANAVLITSADQVTIGDKVWAKVDLFSGLSWNIIDTQCPLSACSTTSSLNGYDMDGWIWATSDDVAVMLSTFTTPLTIDFAIKGSYFERYSLWAPKIISVFGITNTTPLGVQFQAIVSNVDVIAHRVIVTDILRSTRPGRGLAQDFSRVSHATKGTENIIFSGFFYKALVEVPEPSTLALIALGMIGLASRRFKKQS